METASTRKPLRTIREVYNALPEGTLAQLIEDQLVMSPSPTYGHQALIMKIGSTIFNFLEKNDLGKVLNAPYDVHLDEGNVFQPDILFIPNEQLNNIREDGFHGAPALIIELLSPGTAQYDLHQKKAVYERCGVQEYWIVDPDTREAEGYFLEYGKYGKAIQTKGTISSRLLAEDFHF